MDERPYLVRKVIYTSIGCHKPRKANRVATCESFDPFKRLILREERAAVNSIFVSYEKAKSLAKLRIGLKNQLCNQDSRLPQETYLIINYLSWTDYALTRARSSSQDGSDN
jgi:hypothetical protein